MKLVSAKCPICGGTLQVDSEKDAAICEFCKSPFIVEKAIQNYNTTIVNNNTFNGATINVVNQGEDAKKLLDVAISANSAGDHNKAVQLCDRVLINEPNNYTALFIKSLSSSFNSVDELMIKLRYGVQAINYCNNPSDLSDMKNHLAEYAKQLLEESLPFFGELFCDKRTVNDIFDILSKLGINGFYRTVKIAAYESMLFVFDHTTRQHIVKGENIIYLTTTKQHDISVNYLLSVGPHSYNIQPGKSDLYMTYRDGKIAFVNKNQEEDFLIKANKHKESACYVATCVYGSYDCPQVWALRRYRDFYLDQRWWGRLFIKTYYSISPKITKLFGKTKLFQIINKYILDKKVKKLLKKGYEDTPYNDKY